MKSLNTPTSPFCRSQASTLLQGSEKSDHEMSSSWVDIIGEEEVRSVLDQHGLKPSKEILALLDNFSGLVESKIKRDERKIIRKAKTVAREMGEIVGFVNEEIELFRQSFPSNIKEQIKNLEVRKDPETYIPEVWMKLSGLPTIVVMIDRAYRRYRCPITIGFRSLEYCRGRLSGKVGAAANFIKSKLASSDYRMSISQLLMMWVRVTLEISAADRKLASKNRAWIPKALPAREQGEELDEKTSQVQETNADKATKAVPKEEVLDKAPKSNVISKSKDSAAQSKGPGLGLDSRDLKSIASFKVPRSRTVIGLRSVPQPRATPLKRLRDSKSLEQLAVTEHGNGKDLKELNELREEGEISDSEEISSKVKRVKVQDHDTDPR